MNAIRTAAFAAAAVAFAAVSPAGAMTVADLAHAQIAAATPVDFSFGDQLGLARGARLERADATTAQAAAENYFSYDALITLGSLALAGGALAAFGASAARRRAAVEDEEPAWRETVFRAVQADLTQFSENFRRAA